MDQAASVRLPCDRCSPTSLSGFPRTVDCWRSLNIEIGANTTFVSRMEDSDKKRLAVTAEHVPLLGDHREDDKVSTGRDYRGESGRRRLSMVLAVSALMLFLLLARWLIPETALDVIDPFVWFTNVPDSADVVNEEETVVSGNRHHRGKPLIVYIIPHSHDDVGWIKTPDEYYNDQVKHIYKNVIREMSVKPNRTFIVVEQAYFSRWFDNDANNHEREFVRQFLADGRLEFVLGAWAMPDEACTTADAVVEDLAAGHRYIREKFGIQPRYGFQIDPFGHSAAIPALYAQMGFHAVVLNRIHWYEPVLY